MSETVLGFDVSSSCIGIGVLQINDDKSIQFISVEYIKPLKKGNIVERIADTRDKIKSVIEKVKPDHIGIEDIIKFMKGKSSANTIIMLTTFNRMICLLANDYLGHSPKLFNIMSIRHGLKLDKKLPSKEDMPELVAHHLGIEFPYELNRKGNKKVENYDKADGIAVALYHTFLLTDRIKKKKAKKLK